MDDILHKHHKDFRPEQSDDIIPLKNHIGQGPKGNSFKLELVDDKESEALTELIGSEFDESTKEWHEIWRSENINGGRLYLNETVNFQDKPKTFRLMFSYVRPGRKHWSLITPAIPYVDDKHPRRGTDVADMYIKNHRYEGDSKELKWIDVLSYPEGPERQEFNPPNPPGGRDGLSETVPTELGEPWAIALDVPQFIEMAELMGWTYNDLIKALNGNTEALVGKLYPDIKEQNILNFVESLVNMIEVKFDLKIEELEKKIEELEQYVITIQDSYDEAIEAIVKKIYGGNYSPRTKTQQPEVSFTVDGLCAVGNLNVFSNPGSDAKKYALRTRGDDQDGDIRAK